ncbi:mechanosensitive ion channel family protein [Ferrovum myxofaciens]|uniref:Small-conductance mechanosensitive channel n=1 Tax=Ferrovum myxofaciens TaxID=416213 RepID=A0A9E6MWD0_9PROT|nr:mechanosensitive ion channel family protein [Ferrovum myxofaciens]QKE39494.2 MAG: mechanosensitive ion channel family protein [Ferrovum myxofaciens]QWY74770.1 MAG: mechanosensitive ion channel family protein [Ferrovum myxofaciens]QWY77518.1 MAG: mechanosensitive ion channel family protein [Ferrovum myxofaciens]
MSSPEWWLKKLLTSILLILGYVIVTRTLDNIIVHFHDLLKKHRPISSPLSSSYATIFQRVIRWALGLLLLVLILRAWGADVSFLWTAFVGMLTVIGVGLLATWTMASNVTARFFIWFWQPARLGQRIEIFPENLCGRVIEENLMFTEVRQDDGQIFVIPNNLLFQRVIRRTPDNVREDGK